MSFSAISRTRAFEPSTERKEGEKTWKKGGVLFDGLKSVESSLNAPFGPRTFNFSLSIVCHHIYHHRFLETR